MTDKPIPTDAELKSMWQLHAADIGDDLITIRKPMAGQQVIIDFAQVGTAGPFPVVNGHVKLPGATMQDLARMLRPTYEAASGVGNNAFDHQTAADFLNGKTISDEAVRKFVHASRRAHDEKASLSAMLISVRGELASREAEIALLKKALLEAEAAPTSPAFVYAGERGSDLEGLLDGYDHGTAFYTSPQPAPATQQAGEVVAYLDIGAGGYLDLGSALSDEDLQQLPKGRHALVIAGTYGIDGYVAAPTPTSPAEQQAPSAAAADTVVLEAALRAIHQAIDLIGEPDTERLRTVRRVLRGAVIVAEDAGEAATAPQPAPAPLSDDTERLEWLLWKLPGDALRYVVGELADTSSGAEFRAAIDAALAAREGK